MAQDNKTDIGKTGLYERAVGWVTEKIKPSLHQRTMEFTKKAIAEHAEGNERYARIIEFEVRRRGDAAGLTQDVAEPIVWTGVKTVGALSIAGVGESIKMRQKNSKWGNGLKNVGLLGAVLIVANQAFELLRVKARYTAGLQGSLEMALDRIKSIKETGVDPFKQQSSTSREINTSPDSPEYDTLPKNGFASTVSKAPGISPEAIREQQNKQDQSLQRS